MNLTRYEQEVVINLNADEEMATVYSANPAWIRKMDVLAREFPDVFRIKRWTEISKTYEMPKKYVRICRPRELSSAQRENLERMLSDMLISYNKILFELSTFFAYNPERQERINKNVTTTSTFGYLTQCTLSIMITGVERGNFVPVLPVKDIMAFIIASFDGIIRDVTLSKCYAGNSSGVAFHEKNLIHCLYISTMSLLGKNQNER